MKTIVITVILTLVVLALAGIALMYSGSVNVAATNPDWPIFDWIMSTTMDNSVRAHASGIAVPPLEDSALIRTGFGYYSQMCAGCHGSPAEKQNDLVKNFNPPPPELTEAAADWTPAELYWITKNGVKMTGMPAFGPSHSEKGLWALVAFTRKLPKMSAEECKSFSRPEERLKK